SLWTLIASTARAVEVASRAIASAAATIGADGGRPSQRPGRASSLAARKNPKQPLRAGKRRLAPGNTSSPQPLTPALCAEFTTAPRNLPSRRNRSLARPDNSVQSLDLSSGWGDRGQEIFPFNFKGSV